jgi:hypothetical protein
VGRDVGKLVGGLVGTWVGGFVGRGVGKKLVGRPVGCGVRKLVGTILGGNMSGGGRRTPGKGGALHSSSFMLAGSSRSVIVTLTSASAPCIHRISSEFSTA